MTVETELRELREEVKTLSNQLSSMNKYYADAVTKTLITKEDLEKILKHIESVRAVEEPNAKTKNTRTTNKGTKKKVTTKKK